MIGLAGVGGGVYAIVAGSPAAGSVISALSLTSLVGVFIYGTRKNQDESDQ